MPAPTIVFDLDGTLVDTAPDLIDSLNHTIEAANLPPVSYDDVTHLVGQGARTMIERAFKLYDQTIEAEELDKLMARFIAHYGANMPGKSKPFPGLVDALDRLKEANFTLAVCTNKTEKLAVQLIDGLGLSHYFAATTGGDTFAVRKPDAAHLTGTILKAGGDRKKAVMIGDSINDILAAKNAAVPCVAVPFGYTDIPVDQLGADRIVRHYDELSPDLLIELMVRGA